MDESQVRRVIVGVSGSLANRAAVHAAAALARRCDAPLLAVHVCRNGLAHAHDQVDHALTELAVPDLDIEAINVTGDIAAALAAIAANPGDVLVVGTGRQRRLRRWRTGEVHRSCVQTARCLVLSVPPPPMLSELPRAMRV